MCARCPLRAVLSHDGIDPAIPAVVRKLERELVVHDGAVVLEVAGEPGIDPRHAVVIDEEALRVRWELDGGVEARRPRVSEPEALDGREVQVEPELAARPRATLERPLDLRDHVAR